MNAQYFEECIENYTALHAKKIATFVLLELDGNGHTLEEIDQIVSGKIRTTDILGMTHDGKLQIILPHASRDDLKYILPRFEGIDINIQVLR